MLLKYLSQYNRENFFIHSSILMSVIAFFFFIIKMFILYGVGVSEINCKLVLFMNSYII